MTTKLHAAIETNGRPESYQVGKIALPINYGNTKFLPRLTPIIGSGSELETIALGVRENLPVLLIGDTGSGKTSFIRNLAYHTHNGFRRLNLNGSTTPDELVGHYIAKNKDVGMEWVDGVLTDAMRNGYWLLLDELNAALPEVLFVLQSVLDDDRFLVLAEHDGSILTPHANFRVFATMNPTLEYAGTHSLNAALLSRFPLVIQTAYPDAVHELKIIKHHVPDVSDKDAGVMLRVAEEIRKGKKGGSLSFICSTRELINWAKLTAHLGLKQAAAVAVLNKCELDTDKKTIEDLFKMFFGKWERNQILTLSEIEAQLEQMKADVKSLTAELKESHKELSLAKGEEYRVRKEAVSALTEPV